MITHRPPKDPQYLRDYNRGWLASSRTEGYALDAADARGEVDAWYDGYMDFAVGREKWHLSWCQNHGNGEGQCGQA